MYKVIRRFQERFDRNHDYIVGDDYPRVGFVPPEGREEALCNGGISAMNASGEVFITAAEKNDKDSINLESMNKADLSAYAAQHEIKLDGNMTKAQMVATILGAQGE